MKPYLSRRPQARDVCQPNLCLPCYGQEPAAPRVPCCWSELLGEEGRSVQLSSQFIADKVAYALSHGLKVVACIGKSFEQREAASTVDVVTALKK